MMYRLKTTFRLLAVRILLWWLQHRTLAIVFSTLLIFAVFLLLAPSTQISEMAAYFLSVEYLFGITYYVLKAVEKIENTRSKAYLTRITILECELIKKDLNILLPIVGMISSIGLATMVLNPYQTLLPRSATIISGVIIEAMITITFALLYWWFFFYLMERYRPQRAAFWAGVTSFLPFLVGAYATVTIASYFELDILQDFVAAFLPFLLVYYWMNRSIPDYTLSAPISFKAEIAKTSREKERIKKELQVEQVRARKTRLEMKLSKLDVKKKQSETAAKWFKIGYEEIRELQKDFVDFREQMTAASQTYLSMVGDVPRKKIGFVAGNKVFVAKKVSTLDFRLIRWESSISDKSIGVMANILSLREVAIRINRIKRIIGFGARMNFKNLQRSRSNIAVEEATTRDMPEPCQTFDRKTLKEYLPAKTRFELNQAKYGMLLHQMSKYPCSVIWEKFEETQNCLLLSINELRNRIQERIDAYFLLERDHPECYMVKAFKLFLGLFGVAALQDLLRSLERYELEISKRRKQIEKLKCDIKITWSS